jgi:cytochrome b6-f complex iron-sulfur subunit
MAEQDPSIDDILAQARSADGGASATPAADDNGDVSESVPPTEKTPAAPAAEKVDPSSMSVADMLAAARGEGAAAPTGSSDDMVEEPGEPDETVEVTDEVPAAKLDPSSMSVADMLAAARGEGAAPAPKVKPKAKAKVAPKAAPKTKQAVAAESTDPVGPRETASVLAAARSGTQRGPRSFDEAVKAGETPTKPAKPKLEVPPAPRKSDFLPQKQEEAAVVDSDRRGFFATTAKVFLGTPLAVAFTSMGFTSLLWTLGFTRFMFPNVLIEPPTKFKVGFPAGYSPGQVEARYKAQFGVWVVRWEYEGESQIYALKSVCTHLGCTPNWLEGEQKFKCPCHGSGFYKDGVNFEGPAPRPLERYAIRLADDGQLEVDKSRKFMEEVGQWTDPNSYVSV